MFALETSGQRVSEAASFPLFHEQPKLECGPRGRAADCLHPCRSDTADRAVAESRGVSRSGAADDGHRYDAAGQRSIETAGSGCDACGREYPGTSGLASAQDRFECIARAYPDVQILVEALDRSEREEADRFPVHGDETPGCRTAHGIDMAAQGQDLGCDDRPRPGGVFQPFDPAHESGVHVPGGLWHCGHLEVAGASLDRGDAALSRYHRRAPAGTGPQVRRLRRSSQKPLICLTEWQSAVENIFDTITYLSMAEKLAGSEAENRRHGGVVHSALAAMGMGAALLAPEAIASDKTTAEKVAEAQRVDAATSEIQAEVRNCTLDTNRAFLLHLAEQIGDDLGEDKIAGLLEDFPTGKSAAQTLKWSMQNSPEIRDWVLGEVQANGRPYLATLVTDLKDARIEGFSECDEHNDNMRLAALEGDIARINAEYRKHGFRLGENVDGQTVVYRMVEDGDDFVAAYIKRDPETGEISIDFSPLHEANQELRDQIEKIYDQMEKGETIELGAVPTDGDAVIVASADQGESR